MHCAPADNAVDVIRENGDLVVRADAQSGPSSASGVAVRRLSVRRGGRRVLHDVTLDVPAGRITGLIGPSGSGKTTLMRAIAGVQLIEEGDVAVLDAPAGSVATRGRVGYLTQAHAIYPDLTVEENLRFFARVTGSGGDAVAAAVARVRLEGLERRLAGRLSGGQRARVALASVLLGDPPVLVLYEPTVGLDPVLRRELWALFGRLAGEGAAVLVSSHVMDEAERCDDLVLLRDGGADGDRQRPCSRATTPPSSGSACRCLGCSR